MTNAEGFTDLSKSRVVGLPDTDLTKGSGVNGLVELRECISKTLYEGKDVRALIDFARPKSRTFT